MDLPTVALIAAVASPALTLMVRLFGRGKDEGKESAKLAAALDMLAEFRADLKEVPKLAIRIGNVEAVQTRLLSEHRQLRDKLSETREKLASQHDGE